MHIKTSDPTGLKIATAQVVVCQPGTVIARAPTVCHRDKQDTGYTLPLAVPVLGPTCPYIALPLPTPTTIHLAFTGWEQHDSCWREGAGSNNYTNFASLPYPLDLTSDPGTPCLFQFTLAHYCDENAYAPTDCSGAIITTEAIGILFDLNFTSAVLRIYTTFGGDIFLGTLPGSSPFDLSAPLTIDNTASNDPTEPAWAANCTLTT